MWRRIRQWFRRPMAGGEAGPADEARAEGPAEAPLGSDEPLARPGVASDPPEESEALALFDSLHRDGRSAEALGFARRLLRRHRLPALSLRVAQTLSERGDDEAALAVLEPLLAATDPPLSGLALAGEIAERRGALEDARSFYERVLAADVAYPRVRERARRLAERLDPERELTGATVAVEGALARGRYRIERELGRGGAGTVLAAVDLRLQRRVALKLYHRRGPLERERLRSEARTPAGLEHPGVIRVFDVDLELGALAMEWVEGGSVRRALGSGRVPRSRVERWLRTALEAVAFVHEQGFVHLDLKPSNFLLRPGDRVVLTDFGLASPIGATPASRQGAGEGTLKYMPPEQRRGEPAQPSADVHAFGVSLAELIEVCDESPARWVELAGACVRTDPKARPTVAALRELIG